MDLLQFVDKHPILTVILMLILSDLVWSIAKLITGRE
jgi:hypothetical protein